MYNIHTTCTYTCKSHMHIMYIILGMYVHVYMYMCTLPLVGYNNYFSLSVVISYKVDIHLSIQVELPME